MNEIMKAISKNYYQNIGTCIRIRNIMIDLAEVMMIECIEDEEDGKYEIRFYSKYFHQSIGENWFTVEGNAKFNKLEIDELYRVFCNVKSRQLIKERRE